MIELWRISSDTSSYLAEDLSGTGAKITGGRWNRKGAPMVYSSRSIALAVLETMAHLEAGLLPMNRFLVRIDVPDDVWNMRQVLSHVDAPLGWQAEPAGKVSLDYGDKWLSDNACALLQVPSVIVPEECNVLINPLHTDAASIKARKVRQFQYDARTRGA